MSADLAWRELRAELRERALPRRADWAEVPRSWRGDLAAGLSVMVVALPLALGFGVTSGVGAAAGLVTAVVAGLVAALLGGSHLQVSGPTGAMTVVLVPIVARQGPEAVPVVAIMAGGLVLLAGLLGVGRLVQFIPWPVVEGFTAGIGVIIAVQQVPLLLDVSQDPDRPGGENAVLVAVRSMAWADWGAALPALVLGTGTAALVWVLSRWRRSLPSALLAVVAATVVAELARLDVDRIGAVPSTLPAPRVPVLTPEATASLFSAALAVAALAALESLLSARVADGMADDIPRTHPDRELVGQGLANVASGLFGGLPATGAIARTAVNVRSGARTRLAAASHAVLLALVVALAAPLVGRVPLAALAGVLVVTAARMVDRHAVRAIVRSGRSGALVLALTFLATVVFDLVVAVEAGVAVAAVLALRAVARTASLQREELPETLGSQEEHRLLAEHIAVYRIDGALFFGDTHRFLEELTAVADVRVVILRLSGIRMLDTTGAQMLAEVVATLQRKGVVVLLKGLRPAHRRVVEAVGVLAELQHSAHVFDDLDAAIEHARSHVHRAVETA